MFIRSKSNFRAAGLGAGALVAVGLLSAPAVAESQTWIFDDGSGLSALAEFTLVNSTTIQIRLRNTSMFAPDGFTEYDQILSAVSFDLGAPDAHIFDALIDGGEVRTGPTSSSLNFDIQNVGPNSIVSGEYGYSNSNGTGLLQNFISSAPAVSGITRFVGENLNGPDDLDNAEGGLVSDALPIELIDAGAIQREIVSTLTLDRPITDLAYVVANGTRVEFGNDAYFIDGVLAPAPGALALLGLAGFATRRRRR